MKKISYLLIFGFTTILLFLFFKRVDFEAIKNSFATINGFYVSLAGGLLLISHWFRNLRWLMLLKQIQPNLSSKLSFLALLISYASNLVIPHAGMVTRASFLKRKADVPLLENLGTFFAEKLVDGTIVFFFAILLVMKDLKSVLVFKSSTIFDFLGNLCLLIIAGLFLFQLLKRILPERILTKYKFVLQANFDKITKGILTIRETQEVGKFVGLTCLTWFFYFATFYAMFLAFMPNVSVKTAVDIACVGNLSWIFPTQAGIGAFHLAVSKTMLMKGFDENLSNFTSIFLHGTITFYDLLFGLLAYLYTFLFKK